MKIFARIFEAIMYSRQLQAERIVRDNSYFAQQAREYELCIDAEQMNMVSAEKPQTACSFSVPIRGLATY